MTHALAQQKVQTLKGALEKSKPSIAALLPKHMSPERIVKSALMAATVNPEILACDVRSVVLAVMQAAQLGLDCSGVLGQGYLVPFFNRRKGVKEAKFIPGYRGLVTLARRSGEIDDIYAEVVYSDDEFRLAKGDTPSLTHVPNLLSPRDNDKIVGAYMVAWLKGSTRPHIEWMSRADIEKVRERSQMPTGELWDRHFDEACRKTVIRRGIKYLPLSTEDMLAAAARVEEAADQGLQAELLIDGAEVDLGTDDVVAQEASAAEVVIEKISARRGRPPRTRAEIVDAEPVTTESQPTPAPPSAGQRTPSANYAEDAVYRAKLTELWRQVEQKMGTTRAAEEVDALVDKMGASSATNVPVERRSEFLALLSELCLP